MMSLIVYLTSDVSERLTRLAEWPRVAKLPVGLTAWHHNFVSVVETFNEVTRCPARRHLQAK